MPGILIIEDDRNIAKALEIRLKGLGAAITVAYEGLTGLKLALTQNPEVIIMDIWMPIGLGFSVAQRLAALGRKASIIFITASKLQGLRSEAEKLGASAYFEKPYDPEKLLCAVKEGLGMEQSEKSVEPRKA
jgi:DNA-binding response OmpR family regulator